MKGRVSGSALLSVMVAITILTILMGIIIRNGTLFHNFAWERARYQQTVCALNALLRYGIAWTTRINTFETKEPQYEKQCGTWPPNTNTSLRGHVLIQCEPGEYRVTVRLLNDGGSSGEQSCTVKKENGLCVR